MTIKPRNTFFSDSTYCRYWFGCRQPSGEVRDSLEIQDAIKAGSDANAWANAGYLTTGTTAADYAYLPAGGQQDFNLANETFVFSLRFKKATPGTTETIINGYDTVGGIKLLAYSTGNLVFAVKENGGGTTMTATITPALATTLDGEDHVATFFVPRDNVSVQWFVDANKSGTTGNSGVYGKAVSGNKLVIGGSTQSGAAKVAQFATIQAYAVPKDLAQINSTEVHDWIVTKPHLCVPDWVF